MVFKKFMWRTYISGLLDYNSQLWCPIEEGKVSSIEQLLRSYTANTDGLQYYNYWERLKRMGISSIQRMYQRYKLISIWKVITGLTHNFGIMWNNHPHWGILINIVKPVFYETSAGIYSIWRQSLAIECAILFNFLTTLRK